MNRMLVSDPLRPRYGIYRCSEFTVEGDFEAAYKYLKSEFEKPKDNKSGPIKPLTAEERKIEQNQPTADILRSLPEERIS